MALLKTFISHVIITQVVHVVLPISNLKIFEMRKMHKIKWTEEKSVGDISMCNLLWEIENLRHL